MKKITCPNCGAEYLPSEIYIPQAFFGTVKGLEKDENGKIVEFLGESMDLKESYRCDYCNKKFNVICDIKISTDCKSIDEGYSTKIKKPNLFMKED